MKRFLLFFLFCTLCALPPAEAAFKKKHYKLYWRESDGAIVLGSVCDNYSYGSIAYRGCRAQAKRHFEEQCQSYRRKEAHSRGVLYRRYRHKRQRFCRAASQFGAVD